MMNLMFFVLIISIFGVSNAHAQNQSIKKPNSNNLDSVQAQGAKTKQNLNLEVIKHPNYQGTGSVIFELDNQLSRNILISDLEFERNLIMDPIELFEIGVDANLQGMYSTLISTKTGDDNTLDFRLFKFDVADLLDDNNSDDVFINLLDNSMKNSDASAMPYILSTYYVNQYTHTNLDSIIKVKQKKKKTEQREKNNNSLHNFRYKKSFGILYQIFEHFLANIFYLFKYFYSWRIVFPLMFLFIVGVYRNTRITNEF